MSVQKKLVILSPDREQALDQLKGEVKSLTSLNELSCLGEFIFGLATALVSIGAVARWVGPLPQIPALLIVLPIVITILTTIAVFHRRRIRRLSPILARRDQIANSAGGCELMTEDLQGLANQVESLCERALKATNAPGERRRVYDVRFDAITKLMEIDQGRAVRAEFEPFMQDVQSVCTDVIQRQQRRALTSG